MPDALSRLQQKDAARDFSEGELDMLWSHIYKVHALVEMNAQFKQELLEGHQNDDYWAKISHILDYTAETDEDAADLSFSKGDNGLIWRTDNLATDRAHTPERLCVPSSFVKALFDVARSGSHVGRHKCHEMIARHSYERRTWMA